RVEEATTPLWSEDSDHLELDPADADRLAHQTVGIARIQRFGGGSAEHRDALASRIISSVEHASGRYHELLDFGEIRSGAGDVSRRVVVLVLNLELARRLRLHCGEAGALLL